MTSIDVRRLKSGVAASQAQQGLAEEACTQHQNQGESNRTPLANYAVACSEAFRDCLRRRHRRPLVIGLTSSKSVWLAGC